MRKTASVEGSSALARWVAEEVSARGWQLVDSGAAVRFTEGEQGSVRSSEVELVALVDGESDIGPESGPHTDFLLSTETERVRARRLGQILARVEAAERRVWVVRTVGHDLNNALTAVRILGEMVREAVTDPLDRDAMDDILMAADQIGRTVESGVRLARIDEAGPAGTTELRRVLDPLLGAPAIRERVSLQAMRPARVRLSADDLEGVLVDGLLFLERLSREDAPITVGVQESVLELRSDSRLASADLSRVVVPYEAPVLRAAGIPVNAAGLAVAQRRLEAAGGGIEALVEGSQVVLRLHLPLDD